MTKAEMEYVIKNQEEEIHRLTNDLEYERYRADTLSEEVDKLDNPNLVDIEKFQHRLQIEGLDEPWLRGFIIDYLRWHND